MWKLLRKYFLAGLLILLPLIITIYVFVFAFNFLDGILSSIIRFFFGYHLPGLGLLLMIVLIFLAGLFGTNVVGKRLINLGERVLQRIPLVKSIYSATKQVMEAFSLQQQAGFQRVVLVEFPRKGMYSIGFFTGRAPQEVETKTEQQLINVYLPGTPPTSGFFVMVPSSDVTFLEMSVEDGLKLLVSGGFVNSGRSPVNPD
jgi:uncharacterized membrane protein